MAPDKMPPAHAAAAAPLSLPDIHTSSPSSHDPANHSHSPMSAATPATTAAQQSSRVPPRRRRDKPQLSCNLCRSKKLRCDRQQPCSTCSTRGLACHYVADPATLINAIDYRPRGRATSAAQERIRHLERLVISLMEKADPPDPHNSLAAEALLQFQSNAATPPPDQAADSTSEPGLPDELGKLSLSDGTTTWVTSSHWAAVLDDIADLRDHLEYKDGSSTPDSRSDAAHNNVEPELLYGSNRHATREQILSSIPPRSVADGLVATFFTSFSDTFKVVHSRTFLVEYEEFWHSPDRMSIMWIGMLFSMLALAQHFHNIGVATPQPQDPASHNIPPAPRPYDQPIGANVQRLRQKAVQCLVLGRYTHPSPRAVEALVVYLALEYILNPRSDSGIMTLISMIVRLSMQMGYHRDPSHFSTIRPLEAEMRRRTWISIFMLDLNIASQAGVPRILQPWQSDVVEPRNLPDEDLDERMAELPPSRPETEPTSMLFMITRYRMAAAFGIISDLATSTMQPSYSQIMKADQGLLDAHKSIPHCYQPRSAADSIHDPPELIMHRIYVASIFRKSQCVLHRRFLQHRRSDPAYAHSRTTCIKAALALLCLQRAVNEDVQPGRPLFAGRWRILTLVNNDFLLGTMIACGELQRRRKEVGTSHDSTAAELASALATAHTIWSSYGTSWPEASKAADATSIILGYRSQNHGHHHSPHSQEWRTTPESLKQEPRYSDSPPQMHPAGQVYIGHSHGPLVSGFDDAMQMPPSTGPGSGMPQFVQAPSGYFGAGGFDPMFVPDLVYTREGPPAYYPMQGPGQWNAGY